MQMTQVSFVHNIASLKLLLAELLNSFLKITERLFLFSFPKIQNATYTGNECTLHVYRKKGSRKWVSGSMPEK